MAENAIRGTSRSSGSSSRLAGQQVEALVKCQVLNRMVSLRLPVSEHVPATCPGRRAGEVPLLGSHRAEADKCNKAPLFRPSEPSKAGALFVSA